LEDTLGYIIVFGLIIVFTLIYFSKKENEKLFSLTKKLYSFGSFDVLIKKKGSDIEHIILKTETFGQSFNQPSEIILEIPFNENNKTKTVIKLPANIIYSQSVNEYHINYNDFSIFMEHHRKQHQPFRFVIIFHNNKMKSGYIAFNKYGKIYIPDSGRYN